MWGRRWVAIIRWWVGLGWVDVVVGHCGMCGAGDGSPSSISGLGWVGLMWLWVVLGSMGQEMGHHHLLVGWVDVVVGRFGIYGAGEGSPSSIGGLG